MTVISKNEPVIDLEVFRDKNAKVLTGRPYGRVVREKSNIDALETDNERVKVIIPEKIYSIGPSFFEELFVNVIRKLGRDAFRKKFEFVNAGTYHFETPLNEAIERVLRNKTALD